MGIDGRFVIEQTARSRSGLCLSFNGSAGIWSQDAGGWQSDTLTEDLDLSDRAQRRGWRIGCGPGGVVPAELPGAVEALKHQQFRSAKGSLQTARKVLPPLFETEIPWHKRVFAAIHLLG